jgi:hypothetical protein
VPVSPSTYRHFMMRSSLLAPATRPTGSSVKALTNPAAVARRKMRTMKASVQLSDSVWADSTTGKGAAVRGGERGREEREGNKDALHCSVERGSYWNARCMPTPGLARGKVAYAVDSTLCAKACDKPSAVRWTYTSL